jgi:hypothetical protein
MYGAEHKIKSVFIKQTLAFLTPVYSLPELDTAQQLYSAAVPRSTRVQIRKLTAANLIRVNIVAVNIAVVGYGKHLYALVDGALNERLNAVAAVKAVQAVRVGIRNVFKVQFKPH